MLRGLTALGAVGLVATILGAAVLPLAALVVAHTEAEDATRFLPYALPAFLVVTGVALFVLGRRRRRR